jgi:hypothetical protein
VNACGVSALERAGRQGEARRRYRTYASRMNKLGLAAASFPASASGAADLKATLRRGVTMAA